MLADKLKDIVGSHWVVTEREQMLDYLSDETAAEIRPQPADRLILCKPANPQEISRILQLSSENNVPVFPRGGGTGLCGGAVPTENGIILSVERLNNINIDRDNLMAIAGAGVKLSDLIAKSEENGLFFPPHPGDESAQVGGLIACNAGGSRAVKYGIMRNYIKGIDAVLPTGDLLKLGGELLKNNTGYDLMHLIIGSEGTLAVITGAVLRLFPPLAASATMVIPYNSRHHAINTVPQILHSGITPLAIEYMELPLAENSARHLGLEWPCRHGTAYLMIIIDGRDEDDVNSQCQSISRVCQEFNCLEPLIGLTRKEQERLLRIRSNIYPSVKRDLADVLDIAVPPAKMGQLMDAIDRIADEFHTTIPVTGHAGDGNLHPKLMKDLLQDSGQRLKEVKKAIYEETARLGGVMTGEHGLGRVRVPDMHIFLNDKQVELMKNIKKVFDPKGILNPGCVISSPD